MPRDKRPASNQPQIKLAFVADVLLNEGFNRRRDIVISGVEAPANLARNVS